MNSVSRSAAYFEKLYEANPDPWDFAGSFYERAKYRMSLSALGSRMFEHGFEIGCSIGVFTRLLAARCRSLLAVDIVDTALAAARARCAGLAGVRFQNMAVPTGWPAGERFDLVICSEILYFLAPPDIELVAEQARASLLPGGCVLLVNYTAAIDEPCGGDEAAEIFIGRLRGDLTVRRHVRDARFRIDLLA